ncbi:hypothetical protein [Micromonospora sp. NBC_00421]|uniref:hypothetical protein n=1 Tax=Micromonospora sp. NBC_00421 TaxID=2975976 RepID=UPI002E1F74EA
MRRLDPKTLLDTMSGYTQAQAAGPATRPSRLATVDPSYSPTSGNLPKVVFEGEATLSGKGYASTVPVRAGDRVVLTPVGTTYLITGVISARSPASFQLQLGSVYTLTSTPTDLTLTNVTPGYSSGQVSYTVPDGLMVGLAVWTGDFQITGAATITGTVDLTINGSVPTGAPQAIWDPGNVTRGRDTDAAHWPLALTGGTYTFGLRASAIVSSGTGRLNAKHTALSVLLHP